MRVLLFDLFGLFLRNQTPESFGRIASVAGVTPEELEPVYRGENRHQYDAGIYRAEQYWKVVGDELGVSIPWQEAQMADMDSWSVPDDDMIAFARELRQRGTTMALLSNIPDDLGARMRREHPWIAECFHPAIFSFEHLMAKPEERIFNFALEGLAAEAGTELVPADVLFTDDTLVNIQVAQSLGFKTHHFQGLDGLRPVVEEHLAG
ncbi:HAD family hydrolase [Actinobaculum sp. 313]|uniref:HAD family hydrolase n=1 Tax=Actinobaculum sp. 313 TaxID=2495645 RepID=UPI000D525C2D|nr:HAD family hydrolase [Actinobaculum sp. 313]AWE41545.1 hypothetical protein DDD63_00760 [Actinobaculum sp. 313]